MAIRWRRKPVIWTIGATAIATLIVVLVAMNFRKPRQLERPVVHKYAPS